MLGCFISRCSCFFIHRVRSGDTVTPWRYLQSNKSVLEEVEVSTNFEEKELRAGGPWEDWFQSSKLKIIKLVILTRFTSRSPSFCSLIVEDNEETASNPTADRFVDWFNASVTDGRLDALEKLFLKGVSANNISDAKVTTLIQSLSALQKLRVVEM